MTVNSRNRAFLLFKRVMGLQTTISTKYNHLIFIINFAWFIFIFLFLLDDEDLGDASAIPPMVFIGSEDHFMYALGAASGTVIWKFRTLGKIMSSASLSQDEEIVYFGSVDGKVYALGAANGSVVWTLVTQGAVVASPTVSVNGTVFIGSQDKVVYALDGRTGSVVWKTDLGCPIWGAVAVDNQRGLLFVGCTTDKSNATDSQDTPHIFALDANLGKIMWTFDSAGSVYGSPTLLPGGQTVFFASLDHNIYALDRETGKLYWSYDTGSEIESSPVVSRLDGTLYVGLIKGQLIAVNSVSGPLAGKLKWTVNTGGEVVSSPVITEDGRVSEVCRCLPTLSIRLDQSSYNKAF